ncbi:MAG: AAA family ATPase, partial [Chloroflexi bacterium]|nr:AAA family ATPase [Chloroflexota bacterium]
MATSDKSTRRTIFVCQQCGKESLKWLGRCPGCQEWNSLIEKTVAPAAAFSRSTAQVNPPQELSQVAIETTDRLSLPLTEFNRVLGGGLVPGSLVLIGGDPGIGKSTIVLQVSALVARMGGRVVYVSGEETLPQIKLRAERLGITGENLYLLAETDLEAILSQVEELSPSLVVVDSIQAVYLPELD